MVSSEKPAARPNKGSPLRERTGSRRERFLVTDVTEREHRQILQYCTDHKISVSQFLADLVLEDAAAPKANRKDKIKMVVEIEITREDQEKLELLTRLREKESVAELLWELVQPNLDTRNFQGSLETRTIRYYLSDDEHDIATKHIARSGISARNYAAMLALKAIHKTRKKQK